MSGNQEKYGQQSTAVRFFIPVVFYEKWKEMMGGQLRKYSMNTLGMALWGEIMLVGVNYDKDSPDKPHSCFIEKVRMTAS